MDFWLYNLLAKIAQVSICIPLMMFILAIRKRGQFITVKLLGILIIVSGLSDLVGLMLFKFKINPNAVGSIYSILQFVLLSLIYSSQYPIFKKASFGAIPLFLMFAFINLFELQDLTGINSNLDTVSAFVFLIYSLFSFQWLFRIRPIASISRSFMFWFNTGVIIYFGCNILTFISLEDLIEHDTNSMLSAWAWHNGFNIMKNMIFAGAFYAAMRFDQAELATEEET